MKKILLIATGGTIASTESGDGLTPSIDVNQLVSHLPNVTALCQLDGISIMNIDSTNMNPTLISSIAVAIEKNYDSYDGFVISHGTDTMAYTSAALTYMLENVNKPVVLTGSQLPMEANFTDAKQNLSDAIHFAVDGISGVYIVFDGKVINGTRATKVRTRSFDAFTSLNFPVVATVKHGRIVYNQSAVCTSLIKKQTLTHTQRVLIQPELSANVFVLKIFPGMGTEVFDFIKEHYKGVIIESFGIGGIPNTEPNMVAKIQELIEADLSVVITTQCPYEGIDLGIYEVGQKLGKKNIILAGDMTTEALTMKLMWALAHCNSVRSVKRYIEEPYFADRSY